MTPLSFSLVLLGVLLNAAAQLLLKAGTNSIGHFDFAIANAVPIGVKVATQPHIAYPMLSIGYVVNAVAAYFLFGEAVSVQRLTGIGIIIVGVYVVARS